MKPPRLLLMWLITVIVLVICSAVAWRAFHSVEDFALPPTDDLARARQAYQEIAERVPITMNQLNVLLRVYVETGSRAELARHTQLCTELKNWFQERRQTWPRNKIIYRKPANINLTVDVGSMLDSLATTFDTYTTAVAALTTNNRAAQAARANALALRLLEVAGQARGRAEAIEVFLAFAQRWSPSYRSLIIITIGTLVVFVFWLGFLTYRLSFVPLRQKLHESTATIEQQKKLVHFGELAAGLAHEIRNPLTAINARLYTLQRSIPPGSPEAEDATVINGEITRLDRTVKDFLKLARPAEPRFAPLTAQPLFQEVIDLLGNELAKTGILITCADCTDTGFEADRLQLKQVLINLLQNAADAIGRTGTITLSARTSLQKHNGNLQQVVIIEVADTGPGIPAEMQERLFDPFFSTKEHGTGLGLPISARIVTQHNGVLELHSQLGHGATFGIVLPITQHHHAG